MRKIGNFPKCWVQSQAELQVDLLMGVLQSTAPLDVWVNSSPASKILEENRKGKEEKSAFEGKILK